ncbi:arylamine N-acetyltransferase [Novosphingobium sp. RD2P27]|uniref:Arylamine N-acetyltransferase n=1 Tax=Novosphingobium kalidii TaxID=3230299 RepID=A0ABV2D4V8_9SPHN
MDMLSYLARIGLDALPPATREGLTIAQAAHRAAIGFENLDIQLGRGIAVDARSVFDKLVTRKRGGYCFEQNRLFSDALAQIGIANRPLLARVRLAVPPGVVPPRTHVCLLATINGEHWLADAGFGGSNIPPLPLIDGAEATTPDGARHRLLCVGPPGALAGEWRLERAGPALATDGRAASSLDWQPQYTFDLCEVAPDDLDQANHWTATRPGTRFTTLHVVSIPITDGFAAMSDRQLTIYRAANVEKRTIDNARDYANTVRELFRISLSDDEAAQLSLFL